MATVNYARTEVLSDVHVYLWETITNGDDGDALESPGAADRSIQVIGTFGTGGSVTLEGSNLPSPSVDADWFTLTDPLGNDLTFTAAGGKQIGEVTRHIRPHCTAGDGSTDLDVYVCSRNTD